MLPLNHKFKRILKIVVKFRLILLWWFPETYATMSRFSNIRIPPLSAAVNVAWQTIKQQIPEKGTKNQPSESTRFAQTNANHTKMDSEHHELSNMNVKSTNPFLTNEVMQAEDSFNQGYQSVGGQGGSSRQQSLSSVDMSEDDFVEGRSPVKINEYQAAWNVTNAIQV